MTPERQYELETKLIYSLIVAGKSADFTDRAMNRFACIVAEKSGKQWNINLFDNLRLLTTDQVLQCAKDARTGNYTKLAKAIAGLLAAKLDLEKCTPFDLEKIHGFGPKTSRFFIIWARPEQEYAALDVHVLRWLNTLGHDVPNSTPQNRNVYRRVEQIFIAEAKKRGKTARQLDVEIWEAGAGRTQKTAMPV